MRNALVNKEDDHQTQQVGKAVCYQQENAVIIHGGYWNEGDDGHCRADNTAQTACVYKHRQSAVEVVDI